MTLFGYTCPECDAYHATVDNYWRADGDLWLRCDDCGAVERILTALEVVV